MISTRFYRIYDIGREIDLDWLERELARDYFTARYPYPALTLPRVGDHHPYRP